MSDYDIRLLAKGAKASEMIASGLVERLASVPESGQRAGAPTAPGTAAGMESDGIESASGESVPEVESVPEETPAKRPSVAPPSAMPRTAPPSERAGALTAGTPWPQPAAAPLESTPLGRGPARPLVLVAGTQGLQPAPRHGTTPGAKPAASSGTTPGRSVVDLTAGDSPAPAPPMPPAHWCDPMPYIELTLGRRPRDWIDLTLGYWSAVAVTSEDALERFLFGSASPNVGRLGPRRIFANQAFAMLGRYSRDEHLVHRNVFMALLNAARPMSHAVQPIVLFLAECLVSFDAKFHFSVPNAAPKTVSQDVTYVAAAPTRDNTPSTRNLMHPQGGFELLLRVAGDAAHVREAVFGAGAPTAGELAFVAAVRVVLPQCRLNAAAKQTLMGLVNAARVSTAWKDDGEAVYDFAAQREACLDFLARSVALLGGRIAAEMELMARKPII